MKAWIPIILTVLVLIFGWPYIRSCTNQVADTTKEIGGSAADIAGNAAKSVTDAAGSAVDGAGKVAGGVAGIAGIAGGAVKGVADVAGGAVKGVADVAGSAGNVADGAGKLAGNALKGAASLVKKGADFFKFEAGSTAAGFADFLSSGSADAEKTFVLDKVVFKTGGAVLDPASQVQLDRIAQIIAAYDGVKFELQGHTDNTGSVAGNKALSEKRAQSVLNYLASKNISADKMSAAGFGSEKPRAGNDTVEGRAQNRRTEIRAYKS